MFIVTAIIFTIFGELNAHAASAVSVAKTILVAERMYDSGATHAYNQQSSSVTINWKKTSGAKKYEVYVYGAEYKKWTKYKTTTALSAKVTGLSRSRYYQFRVRGVNGSTYGAFSAIQKIKTARMDFDVAGWQAMCRIVYHEVGGINNDMWDKPIVYVADCLVNQYSAAKYTNVALWKNYYKKYNNIQDIIYKSGGFMSSANLTADGAIYSKVPAKVKIAVYGAVYGLSSYKGIANDYGVYYWCNRSYKQTDSRIAYSFKIPWGYFNVWRKYWG